MPGNAPADRGRRIEVHITDADRVVEFEADDAGPDTADHLADELVMALTVDDPGDVERLLEAGLGPYGTVRSGP